MGSSRSPNVRQEVFRQRLTPKAASRLGAAGDDPRKIKTTGKTPRDAKGWWSLNLHAPTRGTKKGADFSAPR